LGEVVVVGPEGGGEDELSGFRVKPGMTWRSVGWWGFLPSMLTTFAGRQGGVGFRVRPGMTWRGGRGHFEDASVHGAADVCGGGIDIGDDLDFFDAAVLVFLEALGGCGAGGDGIGVAFDLVLPESGAEGVGGGDCLVYLAVEGVVAGDELSGFRVKPGMTWVRGWAVVVSGFLVRPGMSWGGGLVGFLPSTLTAFAGRQGGAGFRVKPGMTWEGGAGFSVTVVECFELFFQFFG